MNSSTKRKIEILADTHFNGNISSAIKHILENHQEYDCDEYYSDFTDSEKEFVDNALYEQAEKKFGKKVVLTDPFYYLGKIKSTIFPVTHQVEYTLTKEKALQSALHYKTTTHDYIMKFGVFITVFIYIFAIPISLFLKDWMLLLYPVPFIAILFLAFYIVKQWNRKAIVKEQQKEFRIIKATCTSARYSTGYGETDIAKTDFCFNGYLNYTVTGDSTSSIHEGTQCYLILIDGKTKTVFRTEEWTLDAELSNMLEA